MTDQFLDKLYHPSGLRDDDCECPACYEQNEHKNEAAELREKVEELEDDISDLKQELLAAELKT